ncbi:unnamed protein product [Schistosoma guineensis]|nr:unnamed protein product [Schistosoma guineensis]
MWSNYGHGTQSRTRTCTNPAPKYGGIYCTTENTEIHPCSVKFCPTDGEWGGWTQPVCTGQLNNQNTVTIHLNANLSTSASNLSTNYEFHLNDVPIERSQCSQALTEIYLPGTGYAAKEVSGASSCHTIMDTLNGITRESVGQFADGSTMQMNQSVLRSNDSVVSPSNKSIVHLTTDIYLSGSCTSSLIDPKTTSSPEVELHDSHENLVQ